MPVKTSNEVDFLVHLLELGPNEGNGQVFEDATDDCSSSRISPIHLVSDGGDLGVLCCIHVGAHH